MKHYQKLFLEALLWGLSFFTLSLDFVFVLLGLLDIFLLKLLFQLIKN